MSIVSKLSASKNALDALLTYANEATGQADADIGEAIRTLVDGFGKGGGGSGSSKPFVTGQFTVSTQTATQLITIEHDLGRMPTGFIVTVTDEGVSQTTTQWVSGRTWLDGKKNTQSRSRNGYKFYSETDSTNTPTLTETSITFAEGGTAVYPTGTTTYDYIIF